SGTVPTRWQHLCPNAETSSCALISNESRWSGLTADNRYTVCHCTCGLYSVGAKISGRREKEIIAGREGNCELVALASGLGLSNFVERLRDFGRYQSLFGHLQDHLVPESLIGQVLGVFRPERLQDVPPRKDFHPLIRPQSPLDYLPLFLQQSSYLALLQGP